MEVIIHQDQCIGCGLCESICPEVFRLNDDSLAEVHQQPDAMTDSLQDAVDSCPVSCIEVVSG